MEEKKHTRKLKNKGKGSTGGEALEFGGGEAM